MYTNRVFWTVKCVLFIYERVPISRCPEEGIHCIQTHRNMLAEMRGRNTGNNGGEEGDSPDAMTAAAGV